MIGNFFDSIERYGSACALIPDEGEAVSFREMAYSADTIGRAVDRRSVAFCLCSNNVESVVGYVGLLRQRAIPVLINPGIPQALLTDLIFAYRPRCIYMPKSLAPSYPQWRPIGEFRQNVLIAAPYDPNYPVHDELALLLSTSGSTGSPKLVRQSYGNIFSNAAAIAQYLEIDFSARPITTMPMSYTYGLSIINSHLLAGASILLTDKPLLDKDFWQLLKSQHATTFGGVPFIYEMLIKLRFRQMHLPSLKVLTQAGGKLSPELCREFAEACDSKGIRFIVMYGQTEATARMSYLPAEYAVSKAGSIGIAIPGGELSLVDEYGRIIEGGDVAGELVFRGPNVTLGYAHSYDDLAKGDENCGILNTGDIAKRDSDGFYYIVGRKKRFLKLFGHRVNLDEVEHALSSAGFACACMGQDDEMVIYTEGNDVEAIRKYLTLHTSVNPNGFAVRRATTLPRNESGKILYSAIK